MAEFVARTEVSADPATAFEYLADLVNMTEWDPSVRSVKALGEGAPALGSSYALTTGFYGKAIELIGEITELEAPTRLEVSLDGGRAKGRYLISIDPGEPRSTGGPGVGSTVQLQMVVELSGVARLFDRGLKLALDGMGDNAINGLKKRLDSNQPIGG